MGFKTKRLGPHPGGRALYTDRIFTSHYHYNPCQPQSINYVYYYIQPVEAKQHASVIHTENASRNGRKALLQIYK